MPTYRVYRSRIDHQKQFVEAESAEEAERIAVEGPDEDWITYDGNDENVYVDEEVKP